MPNRILREDLLKELYDPEHPGRVTSQAELDRWVEGVGGPRQLVASMVRAGLVEPVDGGVGLTPSGQSEAVRMIRTHRLLESYAHDADGVPLAQLHDLAERLEHEVDPEAVADMDRLLGTPSVDPHGHPIPDRNPSGLQGVVPSDLSTITGRSLADQPVGAVGRVAMVGDDRNDLVEDMANLGILPQQVVSVVRSQDQTLLVRVGDNDLLQVSRELAERVYVIPEQRWFGEG